MATVNSLAERLRYEIGDIGRSFVYQFIADGVTNRFHIPYDPVDGTSMVITLDGTDVSTTVEVEEATGYIVFDTVPETGAVGVVAGNYFRYFTTNEVCQFITTSFEQHTAYHKDTFGRTVSVTNLPTLEEYPVVVYASTLALYTLATDASFDIDITAPDGVMIPRSERYRQLMQMIDVRKNQYKELCSQLGIGLYKIDVFSLRRISKTTNHYVPIYLPQEIDDRSGMERALISIPTYGSATKPSDVPSYDLSMYQGDSFEVELDFPFDISGYTFVSQIRRYAGDPSLLAEFTITPVSGNNQKLTLSLTSTETSNLPERSYWDIQATSESDPTYQKTYMRGAVLVTREVTV